MTLHNQIKILNFFHHFVENSYADSDMLDLSYKNT